MKNSAIDPTLTNFILDLDNSGRSFMTLKNYKSDANHFAQWFVDKIRQDGVFVDSFTESIPFIHPNISKDYKQHLLTLNTPIKTINRRLSTLRALSRFLVNRQLVDTDFTQGLQNLSVLPHKNDFESIIGSFKTHLTLLRVSKNTIKNYVSDVRHFLAWLGHLKVSEGTLTAYRAYLENSFSASTAQRKAVSIKKFLDWARKNHITLQITARDAVIKPELTPQATVVFPESRKKASSLFKALFSGGVLVLIVGTGIILLDNENFFTPTPTLPEDILSSEQIPSGSTSVLGAYQEALTRVYSEAGVIKLEGDAPGIVSDQALLLQGQELVLSTPDASDGDITLNPDGKGKLNVILEGEEGNLFGAAAANLNSGSLFYGYVGNDSGTYDLLVFQTGSDPETKFQIDANGNTSMAGSILGVFDVNLTGDLRIGESVRFDSGGGLANITGYNQTQGRFEINQLADDYALIRKNITKDMNPSTSDLLVLDLNEIEQEAGSATNTLVVTRSGGLPDSYAIYVPKGNVLIRDNLTVGETFKANGNVTLGNSIENNFTIRATSSFLNPITIEGTATQSIALAVFNETGSNSPLTASVAGETKFEIKNNGDAYFYGSGTTCVIGDGAGVTCASDSRLKQNIAPVEDALTKIKSLEAVTYSWIDPTRNQRSNLGLIAQNVENVFPEAVQYIAHDIKGVDYASLVVPLVKAVQELDEKVEKGVIASSHIFTEKIIAASVVAANLIAENIKAGTITATKIAIEESLIALDIITTNITAGTLVTKKLVAESSYIATATVDNLLISSGLVTPSVKTALITPNSGQDLVVRLESSELEPESRFVVQNTDQVEVSSIDTRGNAYFAGSISAADATLSGTVNSNQLAVSNDATIAGTIYADRVIANFVESPDGLTKEKILEIENLLKEIEFNQKLLSGLAQTTEVGTDEVATDNNLDSTYNNLSSLSLNHLFVTDQAAFFSMSVSTSLAFGTDMVISSQDNSINTLFAPLSLQSLALAPIDLMAGKVRINTNGDVEIFGNLYLTGNIHAQNAFFGTDAAIDASGSAEFRQVQTQKLIIAADIASPSASLATKQIIESNASAGKATVAAGLNEIIVRNENVSDKTLVYVTPTSTTKNRVLYVKAKGEGFFIVGFSNVLDVDVEFNWWVIDLDSAEE